MKTRIIQTRFWDDEFIAESDIYTQHLYLYLLTSQYINISGMFQLPERKIMFEAKLSQEQFINAKQNLEANKKVFFCKGWVYLVNAGKNNNYVSSPSNKTAYERELSRVPEEIRGYFNSSVDSSVDSTVGVLPTVHIIHKSEIINKKKSVLVEILDLPAGEIQRIAEKYKVSPSFVLSKQDDVNTWVGEMPSRASGRNLKLTLMSWVKKDAVVEQKKNPEPVIEYADFEDEKKWGTREQLEEQARKVGIL